MKISYTRPPLYKYQTAILDCIARFTFTIAATKVGKTASHIIWLFEQALVCKKDQSVWWVAPTYSQAKIAYDRMKVQISDSRIFSSHETSLTITLATGAKIVFKSADKADNLYGDDVYAIVFDEYTRARETAWHALRSTVTSTGGKIKFIGNAKSRKNWGVKLAMKAASGQDKDYAYFKITAYDAAAEGMLTKDGRPFLDEIESAKQDLPEHVFSELYLAEPGDDNANPFGIKHIAACCYQEPMSTEKPTGYGVDLAKKIDWTTLIGLDKLCRLAYYDTWTKQSWKFTTDKIKTLSQQSYISADGTGVGDPIAEDLSSYFPNFESYIFTPLSKQQLMEGLALAFQTRKITIYDDGNPTGLGRLKHQLEQFEYSYTRNGGVRYTAPDGEHDDDVCSLALAYHMWKKAPQEGAAEVNMSFI
jgi:hypothetical protein